MDESNCVVPVWYFFNLSFSNLLKCNLQTNSANPDQISRSATSNQIMLGLPRPIKKLNVCGFKCYFILLTNRAGPSLFAYIFSH